MNDNELYELIDSSFDDMVRLDFEDVKARIDSQPQPVAVPRRKYVAAALTALAACLALVVGISAVFGSGMLSGRDTAEGSTLSEAYTIAMADMEDNSIPVTEDTLLYGTAGIDELADEEAAVEETTTDSSYCDDYCDGIEAENTTFTQVSESDLSCSDLSESDY